MTETTKTEFEIWVRAAQEDALQKEADLAKTGASEVELARAGKRSAELTLLALMVKLHEKEGALAEAFETGASSGAAQHARDEILTRLHVMQNILDGARMRLVDAQSEQSDLRSRELTQAAVAAAEEAARASRTTARATVWLAIVTGLLIIATVVAAIISPG